VPASVLIAPAGPDLRGVGRVYAAVGFRSDLVDDLAFLRDLGGAVFVALHDDEVIGVSSCMPFGTTGWVGGVAVLPEHGRRGLGRALTQRAMDELRRGGTSAILLHATEAGRPLYERMGFAAEGEVAEFHGPAVDDSPDIVGLGGDGDLDTVLAVDAEATGEDRGRIIRALWPRGAHVVRGENGLLGYGLRQLEPSAGAVIAVTRAAGEALVRAGLSGEEGEDRRVGVPVAHGDALRFVEALGYRERTRTTRMHLGPAPRWHAERIFSAFNLYWG
jgi:predicted N-acetyltransferase YhbS